jgi:iron-sulfur cluster assembly accessory protein
MNSVTDTEVLVNISQAAADKLTELMDEKGVRDSHALRVFVQGGGCSGLQYGMAFDDEPRETDVAFFTGGVRVVVDAQSALYLTGASIDFSEQGFQIDNPNVASSCDCSGSSDSGCGSGGCSGCH